MSEYAMKSIREKLCRELDEVARKPDLGAGDRYSERYSRDGMREHIEGMMRDAQDDRTREALRRCLDDLG